MCDSRAPLNGADSVLYESYRVTLHDHDDGQLTIRVLAIGPEGAKGTAIETARTLYDFDASGVLAVEVAP